MCLYAAWCTVYCRYCIALPRSEWDFKDYVIAVITSDHVRLKLKARFVQKVDWKGQVANPCVRNTGTDYCGLRNPLSKQTLWAACVCVCVCVYVCVRVRVCARACSGGGGGGRRRRRRRGHCFMYRLVSLFDRFDLERCRGYMRVQPHVRTR